MRGLSWLLACASHAHSEKRHFIILSYCFPRSRDIPSSCDQVRVAGECPLDCPWNGLNTSIFTMILHHYVWSPYVDRNCSHYRRWAIAAFYSVKTHLDSSGSEKYKMPIKNKHSVLHRRRLGEFIIRTERRSRFPKSQLSVWIIRCFLQISVFLWKDYSIVGDSNYMLKGLLPHAKALVTNLMTQA